MSTDTDDPLNHMFRMSVIKRHLDQSKIDGSAFIYTLPNGCLNSAQREEYEKNGYIVVRNLVSSEKLDKYISRFQKICSEKLFTQNMTVMKDVAIAKSEFLEGEKAITKIQDFCFDDELFEYCCLPEIVAHVKSITGSNVMAMHTMLINKPPG
jgi:phytanoyl-CoA hydroxylase